MMKDLSYVMYRKTALPPLMKPTLFWAQADLFKKELEMAKFPIIAAESKAVTD